MGQKELVRIQGRPFKSKPLIQAIPEFASGCQKSETAIFGLKTAGNGGKTAKAARFSLNSAFKLGAIFCRWRLVIARSERKTASLRASGGIDDAKIGTNSAAGNH